MKIKLRPNKKSIHELKYIPELNYLAGAKGEIHRSNFYQEMQTAEELDASFAGALLTPQATILMAKIIANAPMLHTLKLDNNDLQNIVEVMEIISDSKSLRILSLRYNHLGEKNAISVAKAITKMNQLDSLDLGGNSLASQAPEVTKIIAGMNIRSLGLWGNALYEHGIGVAKAIAGMDLHILDLGGNHLGRYAIDVVKSIAEMNLSALYFSGNNLGRFGVGVSEAIAQMNLSALDLNENDLGAHAPKAAENLSKTNLSTLMLGGNNLRWHAPEVAKQLVQMNQLTFLSLKNNCLQEKTTETVDILLKSPTISEIDLRSRSAYFLEKPLLDQAKEIVRARNEPIKILCEMLYTHFLSSKLPYAAIGVVKEYVDDSITCIFNPDWGLQG